jgi:hypothetical protein
MPDESLKSPAVAPSDADTRASSPSARRPDSPAPGEGNVEPVDVLRDKVELPMTLRTLPDGSDTEPVPQGTLPTERMREVLRRLAENVYDSTEVRDVIARRVQRDLGLSPESEAP